MTKTRMIFLEIILILLVFSVFSISANGKENDYEVSRPEYDVMMEMNVKIPMQDGINLATDIYRPHAEGKFPVVLVRTPYGSERKSFSDKGKFYAQRGYVYAVQDCRGKYDSEGDWYVRRNGTKDGDDTITWLGTQSWSSGSVGMVGSSYLGMNQWQVAHTQNPYLKALVPIVAPITLGRSPEKYRKLATYCNSNSGVGNSAILELFWLVIVNGRVNQNDAAYDFVKIVNHLPLIDIPKLLGRKLPGWERLLHEENGHFEQYLKRASEGNWKGPLGEPEDYRSLYERVNIPILQISGWFDCASEYCFYNYQLVKQYSKSLEAKKHQQVLMGPWPHRIPARIEESKIGDIDFGSKSVVGVDKVVIRWFDRWLKGISNGVENEPQIKVFVMGKNDWREASDWPIPGTKFSSFYFHSSGNANDLSGDGGLSPEMPSDEPPDKYVYDPSDPTHAWPGLDQNVTNTTLALAGPVDMRPIEKRSDVLVYTTAELKEDIEVTGPLAVVLYVSTSAPATDFFVRLLDVHPNGSSYPLFYGYANPYSTRGLQPVDKSPDGKDILKCEIELPPTSNLFVKGHRIRVEVCSSAFPLFRNLNIGGDIAYATEFNIAKQTIYHDKEHPSHIVLPIIPQHK